MRRFVMSVVVLVAAACFPAWAAAQSLETVINTSCASQISSFKRIMLSEGAPSAKADEFMVWTTTEMKAKPVAELADYASMKVADEGDAMLACVAGAVLKAKKDGTASAAGVASPKPTAAPVNLDPVTACVKPLKPGADEGGNLYGSMQNTCNFDVSVVFCIQDPAPEAWTEAFNCAKGKSGLETISANAKRSAHVGNTGHFLWIACRQPATPQTTYNAGAMRGTCK